MHGKRWPAQHGVFRHAGLAVFPYTAANDGIAAARNRDVNAARPNGAAAFHQGKITLLCSLGEFRRGKGILRTQHKAAGVFINAVDRRNTPSSPRHFRRYSQPFARVPLVWFNVGCTAMPAGLFNTAANSSS